MNKPEYFEKELNYIKNNNIKMFAIKAIETLPDYFFEVPASSTGKYHPQYALGEGGLLRHTKAAVGVAVDLFRLYWWNFTEDEKDLIIVSLILHDGWKSGLTKSNYTVSDHPKIAKFALDNNDELKSFGLISDEYFDFITGNILSHMGGWNKDYKTGLEIMPKPSTPSQKFVHFADYIASRKFLEFNFDVDIIRD